MGVTFFENEGVFYRYGRRCAGGCWDEEAVRGLDAPKRLVSHAAQGEQSHNNHVTVI
jgi:hypothetical protein